MSSELTLSGFVAENTEGRGDLLKRLRRDLELAVQAALSNHGAWRDALTRLSDGDESHLAFHAMRRDHCESGRVLTEVLEKIVRERAAEDTKEAFYSRYGIDLDEEDA